MSSRAVNPSDPIIILGGGPAGLGAASVLAESGRRDWALYERDEAPGGLSRSFRDERGFTWDIGGHVVFSHYEAFTRLLDGLFGPDGWLYHERESWIRILGRWVPYPFQNNIHRLPEEQCARCLEDLQRVANERPQPPFTDFDDLIARTMGAGIADLFMRPYNWKVWGYPTSSLNASWTGERVAAPDAARVARNVALKKDDVSWGPNNRFRFPRHGGTGAIWEAVTRRLPPERLRMGCEATAIDTRERLVRFSDGSAARYGALISTMPLDRLGAIADREDWRRNAAGLRHSSVHVVGVGLKGRPSPELAPKCWMYFPEDSVPFYRVTHFSHYSPNNVDDIARHWSLMAEVSESPEKPVDAAAVTADVVRGMAAAGLIESAGQVTHTWRRRVEYGYPTPSLERDAILKQLLPSLMEAGIWSRGRFGAWLYEAGNMDHCHMQGLEAARHLLEGAPEVTVWRPHEINRAQADTDKHGRTRTGAD